MSSYFDLTHFHDFLNRIIEAEKSIGNPKIVWYRGQSDHNFKLTPSLFRYPNGKHKESELFEKFKQLSGRIFPERKNDWEILFDMQHHFIPTRLVDWTEVLGVAIFFALLNIQSNDPAVFVLNPIKLNKNSNKNNIPMVNEERDFDYRKIYWEKKPFPPIYPIAIEPPYKNERITSQRGKFTISGDNEEPLGDQFPDCVQKVILPSAAIEGAQKYLKISGIDEFSIFPDIVGLAPFIMNVVDLG